MAKFPIVDLSRALPSPIDPILAEQWETLCMVATPVGLCPNRALDLEDPVRICAVHQSVVIAQAMRRLKKDLDEAIAEDEKRAQEAEEASHAGSAEEDGGQVEPGPGIP